MTDHSPADVIFGIIGKHSPLPPEEAEKLAQAIVDEMNFSIENAKIKGLGWLSLPPLHRWVSSWRV